MSSIFNSDDFGLKIYNRFPPKYREDDVGQNYALKRYLQALSDGGFKYSIDEINGITTLVDPDKVDAKVLPVLFQQYGLDIFNGIPEEYLRYLLPKLGEAWSKKGSLSVVEFITSSLSGIKTSTQVSYDEKNNPIVSVKLEMDYNIGDYFPEAEQFTRLLENFVPFYCDINMVYSYLFYETQILVGKEQDLYNVVDTKDEKGAFSFDGAFTFVPMLNNSNMTLNNTLVLNTLKEVIIPEPDAFEDIISLIMSESSKISKVADSYLSEKYGLAPVLEQSTLKEVEIVHNTLSLLPELESASIKLQKELEDAETNAVLGEAIIGVAVLGTGTDDVDTHKDHVAEKVADSGSFVNPVDTATNRSYNVLNSSFFTNGLYCYDLVTVGGTTEVVF